MPTLIFKDRAGYDAFEAKMAARGGIPKPGRNASSGKVVDPDNLTGKGWTTRLTDPTDERAGLRVMTDVKEKTTLDADDAAKIETRKAELDKFGSATQNFVESS